MKYKVTAIRDVVVRAYMPSQQAAKLGNFIMNVPKDRQEWVQIPAGASKITGLVIGVDPRYAPQSFPINIDGVAVALMPSYSSADLPAEYFGLFRLEAAE